MTTINKVKEFMELHQQDTPNSPLIPSRDILKLRLSLMLEELGELAEAAGCQSIFKTLLFEEYMRFSNLKDTEPNLVEVLDALLDSRYVGDGAIVDFGMSDIFGDGFIEVHNSNMSKACKTMTEAQQTKESYILNGISVKIVSVNDYYIIRRNSDNKVLKSILYSPANLQKFINK